MSSSEEVSTPSNQTNGSSLLAGVFGKPYTSGETTMIPVARVRSVHSRSGRVQVEATPVATIVISRDGVRLEHVANPMPLILLGLLAGAWNVYWIAKTIREWRRGRYDDL